MVKNWHIGLSLTKHSHVYYNCFKKRMLCVNRILVYLLTFNFYLFTPSCSSGRGTGDEGSVSTVLPDEITEVRAMRLELTDFHHELVANGTVWARSRADLRFQISENIAAIYVRNGDRVTKGRKIAMLDRFKLQNACSQARDNLERAKLDLQDVLIGQGYSLSDSAGIPDEVMQLARVRSNYNNSVNQYELAEYNLQHSILYAPFDGIVANLFSKPYNLPDGSQPFCTIIDILHPEAIFKVLESELPYLRTGDKIRVSPFSAGDYSAEGNIVEINPSVDRNGMVTVKAYINNPQNRLYDGMNVKILMQRSLGHQLVIPKEALVLRTNRKVVFSLKNGRAQWAYVQTGLENSDSYVVTEGLTAGDSVIYEGNINLAHETPVKLKR
jgi:RND family efflux transporter MFP subunit